jgi:hypothetical protein
MLKKKDGRGSKSGAYWAAWRTALAARLPPKEFERKESHRKSQAKWWASLTPEQFKHQIEKKRERRHQRARQRKMAKAAE